MLINVEDKTNRLHWNTEGTVTLPRVINNVSIKSCVRFFTSQHIWCWLHPRLQLEIQDSISNKESYTGPRSYTRPDDQDIQSNLHHLENQDIQSIIQTTNFNFNFQQERGVSVVDVGVESSSTEVVILDEQGHRWIEMLTEALLLLVVMSSRWALIINRWYDWRRL